MEILVTKRLTLRPPLEVDAETMADALGNYTVSSMLARVPHPYSLDDAQSYIAEKRLNPEPCQFTVHRNTLVGMVGVHDREELPTLGYWFGEPHWGKGYATEACRAVLARAFRLYGTDVIASYAFDENVASLRVMEKLGFEVNGKGTAHCAAQGKDMPHTKTQLTRAAFERRFGSLETARAA